MSIFSKITHPKSLGIDLDACFHALPLDAHLHVIPNHRDFSHPLDVKCARRGLLLWMDDIGAFLVSVNSSTPINSTVMISTKMHGDADECLVTLT
jgi:hypothetical protein